MKEAYFIPVSEVLPQEEMVTNWVNDSNARFNTALRIYGTSWNKPRSEEDLTVFEIINGERIFTGSNFCVDGSIAYGQALQKKFPFVKNVQFVDCNATPVGFHTLLSFSADQKDYFLDSTYGQIERAENNVKLELLRDIDKFYTFKPIYKVDAKAVTNDSVGIQMKNGISFSDFNLNYKKRDGFENAEVNGISTKAIDYLLATLMDQ